MSLRKMGLVFSLLGALAAADSCGGSRDSNAPPASIPVSVSPSTATVHQGGTQQFQSSVMGTSYLALPPTKTRTLNTQGARSGPVVMASYGKLPLSFETNRGQTDTQVKFLSRGPGYTLFLTPTRAVLSLRAASDEPTRGEAPLTRIAPSRARKTGIKLATVTTRLVSSNPAARITGLEQLPGKVDYFIGNDPAKWRTNVPTYGKVRYESVYPGVDLVYYGNQRQLEYDFVIAPGADPRIIRLAIAGTEKLEAVASGDLVLHTRGGEIRLHKPIVYQQVTPARKSRAATCSPASVRSALKSPHMTPPSRSSSY